MTRDDKMFLAFKIAMTALMADMLFGCYFMLLGAGAGWPVLASLGLNMAAGAACVGGLVAAIVLPVGLWFLPPLYERPNDPPPYDGERLARQHGETK